MSHIKNRKFKAGKKKKNKKEKKNVIDARDSKTKKRKVMSIHEISTHLVELWTRLLWWFCNCVIIIIVLSWVFLNNTFRSLD